MVYQLPVSDDHLQLDLQLGFTATVTICLLTNLKNYMRGLWLHLLHKQVNLSF